MRRILRSPLTWLICAELAICLALLGWGLHMYLAGRPQPATAAAPPDATASGSGYEQRSPLPPGPASPPARRPKPPASPPGLPPGFMHGPSLSGLNHEQAAWEAAQWTIVHAAIDAGRAYLERVVLPAVTRAQRQGASR